MQIAKNDVVGLIIHYLNIISCEKKDALFHDRLKKTLLCIPSLPLLSFLSCILTPDPLTCGDIVKVRPHRLRPFRWSCVLFVDVAFSGGGRGTCCCRRSCESRWGRLARTATGRPRANFRRGRRRWPAAARAIPRSCRRDASAAGDPA